MSYLLKVTVYIFKFQSPLWTSLFIFNPENAASKRRANIDKIPPGIVWYLSYPWKFRVIGTPN